jgi:hypothetical protein
MASEDGIEDFGNYNENVDGLGAVEHRRAATPGSPSSRGRSSPACTGAHRRHCRGRREWERETAVQ